MNDTPPMRTPPMRVETTPEVPVAVAGRLRAEALRLAKETRGAAQTSRELFTYANQIYQWLLDGENRFTW